MKTNNREHELIKEAFVGIESVGGDKFSLLDLLKKEKFENDNFICCSCMSTIAYVTYLMILRLLLNTL